MAGLTRDVLYMLSYTGLVASFLDMPSAGCPSPGLSSVTYSVSTYQPLQCFHCHITLCLPHTAAVGKPGPADASAPDDKVRRACEPISTSIFF